MKLKKLLFLQNDQGKKRSQFRVLLDMKISECNNIIYLTSVTHNRLFSEALRQIIQYAWYVSGYTGNHSGSLTTITYEYLYERKNHIGGFGQLNGNKHFLSLPLFEPLG